VRRRLRSVRLSGEAGYNLIEMLTVMVIMSVVFAGITTVFVAGSKAQNEQNRRFQAQLNTRIALDKIRKDIHRRQRLHEPLRALPATWNHMRLQRRQVRGLPHDGQRVSHVRAHGRLRLSRLPSARLPDQPERQHHGRPVRAHRHRLPEEQYEDLR